MQLDGRRKKVSPQVETAIAELRERGWSYQRIAMKFGISTGSVHYHCLKQGAFTPRTPGATGAKGPQTFLARDGRTQRRFTPDEDARLVTLSQSGLSPAKIAIQVGRAPTSVRIRLMTLALHQEMDAAE